jgi:hypothetical protein
LHHDVAMLEDVGDKSQADMEPGRGNPADAKDLCVPQKAVLIQSKTSAARRRL